MLATVPIASQSRRLILLVLAVGWIFAGCQWAIRRHGRRAGIPLAHISMTPGCWAAIAYWLDGPNRWLVSQIEQFPGFVASSKGTFLTGPVDYVYIGSEARDADVLRFTELDR